MVSMLEAPINSLPDEVLAAIFNIAADAPVVRNSRRSLLPFPILLFASRTAHGPGAGRSSSFAARPRMLPLDLSFSVEQYILRARPGFICGTLAARPDYYIDLTKLLPIAGLHAARWRTVAIRGWEWQRLMDSMPSVTTLVLRNLHTLSFRHATIESSTVSSLVISFFPVSFERYPDYDSDPCSVLTETFILHNLERLEIVGGFIGADKARLPEEWEEPLLNYRLHIA
ncbi:hypothetical protein GGX14DRAFT_569739 [Mycena pura]|uniref:Uncharacterized protein n=1 Tax=Mycena pura TaxID=153505 RepID=A0AAD6V6Y7_9AGAR|nr:hypothetical protein GGX14DRAFT_569739 [Mycena pura]